ncbi:ATP-binding protein [Aquiflexum sp.]|uniref:sensor histidine kinase n=1 Tax=Aquiflexum sp. TaxID=1872584 RepID=UPI003594746E
MENTTNDHKIILSCNKHGIVEHISLDTVSFLENIQLPIGLHSLFSPVSIKELGSFWLSIQEKSIVENTMLTMSYNDNHLNYVFSGYLLEETVLLCGNNEISATEKVLGEIMQINNEQANQIRITEKKVVNILNSDENKEISEAFLDDFTSLNNELINNKRVLTQKNKEIESLNKELKAANENMTMFTYSVSHDLKQPVRMVNSFLTLLHKKHGESLDPAGQKYLNIAMDGANSLSKMISDLLTYHQSSNLDTTETVDLNIVFLEVKKILQNEIEEKNALVTSEKLPVLKGSSTGFFQVFQNLISNALKFVPEERTPIISINLEEVDTHFTFKIKDNGIGIAENKKQEVFNLFKRLNGPQQYEGTGMGLAMVKKSIERMGGEVWLESEEGKGSTFFFTIKKSKVAQN